MTWQHNPLPVSYTHLAINTNIAIVKALKKALTDNLVSAAALALIESTDRETTNAVSYTHLDVYKRQAEGVSFAIILSNCLVPIIEKVSIPRAFGMVKEIGRAHV